MDVLKIIQEILPVKELKKMHGIVHRRVEAKINGISGFLVWDFVIWNEITFDDKDGNIMSFFTSISDSETEAEWNRLVKKYGVNID